MITDLLIVLCIVFSLYAWTTSADLAFSQHALFNGDIYTLLTGLFVHGNLVHLAGNMLFLYVFGRSLEKEVGDVKTLTVFLTGGILSFILSMPFYPGATMVGASAAIFSVMSALLLVRRADISIQFLSPLGPLSVLFLVFNIAAIKSGGQGNVAYISHVIGFVIGLFFGARWNKKWKESLLYTIVLLAAYIVLYNYLTVRIG